MAGFPYLKLSRCISPTSTSREPLRRLDIECVQPRCECFAVILQISFPDVDSSFQSKTPTAKHWKIKTFVLHKTLTLTFVFEKKLKIRQTDAASEKWRRTIIDVSLWATNRLWSERGLIWFNLTGKLRPVKTHMNLGRKFSEPFSSFSSRLSPPCQAGPRCVSRDGTSSR